MSGNVVDPTSVGEARFVAVSAARFEQIMSGRDVMLDEACLAVSGALRGPLDEIEWIARIDLLAGECPTPTAEGVARYLFGELGFRGDQSTYYDWRNSCLDLVIARRVGIPLTLSILMIEVAQRLGVRLVGVGMPAHFLVGDASDPTRFFDPFSGGAPLDVDDVRALFERVTQGKIPWNDSFLEPSDARSMLIRLLNNLRSIFHGRRDAVRLGIVMQLRAALPELAESEHDDIVAATALFN